MSSDQNSGAWWLAPLPAQTPEGAPETNGLSAAEVTAKLTQYGPNLFSKPEDKPLLLQYLTRFKNPLVLIRRRLNIPKPQYPCGLR